MEFLIADTFTDSLTKLTAEEQKAVKTTVFDLQTDPSRPGLEFHRVKKSKDPDFWVIYAGQDIRVILHKTEASLLVCYTDHHDAAYDWAERRKLQTHPKTGAAQFVEVRERVEEVIVPKYVQVEQPKPLLFEKLSDDELLSYGVPPEWLHDVRAANEDTLFDVAGHLPKEAQEALLQIATDEKPEVTRPVAPGTDPFDHPDAKRRFRTMKNVEELELALNYPWEKWTIWPHPAQTALIEREFNGPARVSGSAGTGKTVVALHRAAHLARSNPDARILLTTFSDALANALRRQLNILLSAEPRVLQWLRVHSMDAIGQRLYKAHFGEPTIATPDDIRELLQESGVRLEGAKVSIGAQIRNLLGETPPQDGFKFSLRFLMTEWEQVVDAWQLESWEDYRDVRRLGRKTRLSEPQRKALWEVFTQVRSKLKARGLVTYPQIFGQLTALYTDKLAPPYDYVILDEAQDVSVSQLRFLAALAGDKPNGLFFSGDLGQQIFQQPFSWMSLGVDVRGGRSRTLRVNYRTSHQIRARADRLLGAEIADVDGITERRRGTVSVFDGPEPDIKVLDSADDEAEYVAEWLTARRADGLEPHEIGIFVRSSGELERAITAADAAGLPHTVLDENVETTPGLVSISTMHLAKGLEFRAVAVIACDDEVIPLQERIETVADGADLEEVYNTERNLLYVACTRARDHLLVTGADPASEFLDDLEIPAPSSAAQAE